MNPLKDCVKIRRHSRRAKKETLHIFKALVICAVSGKQENLPFSQEQGLLSPQAGAPLASLPHCGRRGLPRCLVSLKQGPDGVRYLGLGPKKTMEKRAGPRRQSPIRAEPKVLLGAWSAYAGCVYTTWQRLGGSSMPPRHRDSPVLRRKSHGKGK